ncbi:hypothetical protein [Pseudoalteromonas phage J2-1_QLiu-2017]|nr:hypothetical protein [Pseudoalteromonas phage J2-1_QLiu-2017]
MADEIDIRRPTFTNWRQRFDFYTSWENGKYFFADDPVFEPNDYPFPKMVSFFVKQNGKPVIVNRDVNGNIIYPDTSPDFTIQVGVDWFEENLKRTIRYKKKWTEYDKDQLGNLLLYLEQIKSNGFRAGILSKQEFAAIAPKKK